MAGSQILERRRGSLKINSEFLEGGKWRVQDRRFESQTTKTGTLKVTNSVVLTAC
jgi:hypothetical protein